MVRISDKLIGIILMIFSSFGLALGLLVILGVISSKYVWGGRVTETSQLIILESITFIVNGLILWIIAMRVGFAKQLISDKKIRLILIVLATLMALNTVGNIFAQTSFEKIMAIPTLIGSIGFYFLAQQNKYK